jgi:hypothetical protein
MYYSESKYYKQYTAKRGGHLSIPVVADLIITILYSFREWFFYDLYSSDLK